MKTADKQRRLCKSCREAYEAAGYELEKIWAQYKKPCDICTHSAWLYIVDDSRKKT